MAVILPILQASGASGRVGTVLIRASAAGLLAALAGVSVAGGAPSSSAPPSISGFPGYNSLLTCKDGSWSSDAQTFEYAWAYAANGSTIATGKTWRADAPRVGYDVVCQVTAKDGSGAGTSASSAAVRIGPGRTTIVLKAKKVQHRKVTLTGKVGPKAAVKGASVVGYRIEPDGLHQLFGKTTLKPGGQFKIVAPDIPGRHTYKVNFNAGEPTLWQPASAKAKVRIKKR
jgi:hypothetical protein